MEAEFPTPCARTTWLAHIKNTNTTRAIRFRINRIPILLGALKGANEKPKWNAAARKWRRSKWNSDDLWLITRREARAGRFAKRQGLRPGQLHPAEPAHQLA